MKKYAILAGVSIGLSSLAMGSILVRSSTATSLPHQLLKQASSPTSPTIEISPTVEDQQPRFPTQQTLPEPEVFQSPATTITPQNGAVDIRLINQTNVPVWYSVLGDTGNRMMPAQSEVYLSGLGVPIEMTFYRDDAGFVTASPQVTSAGVLELRLDEAANFSDSDSGLIIQETGDVVIN